MRKKSLLGLVSLMAGACAMVIISCNKSTVDSNTTTATDNATAELEFMRLLPMVNSLCQTYPGYESRKGKGVERVTSSPHYPVVSCDTVNSFPLVRTMTINYGSNTVDSSDGRTRSGIITVSFNAPWRVYGFGYKASLTFSNYSVTTGGTTTGYTGTVYLERIKDSTFTETIGGAIMTQGKNTMSYTCSRTFYWTQGHNDSVASHSMYNITGNGSGMDHNKVNYTDNITSTLIYAGNCHYLEKGVLQIVPAGNSNRTVAFGNTCSNSASVTIDGNSYNITLN
jgi:hypothetical protein